LKPFSTYEDYETLEFFTKAVMKKIEETAVEIDDFFEDALFIVSEDGDNEILNADTLSEKLNVPLYFIISNTIPNKIKQKNTKYYAMVNTINDENDLMILLLTVGDKKNTNCYLSYVLAGRNGFLELGPWETADPTLENFAPFTIPIRRAIVNQG
jgi:hypothetical protein